MPVYKPTTFQLAMFYLREYAGWALLAFSIAGIILTLAQATTITPSGFTFQFIVELIERLTLFIIGIAVFFILAFAIFPNKVE